ncbi:MAG: YitT family protein [Clostridia bacterium]|nr:YitT family protein [Clostridia bacterium]
MQKIREIDWKKEGGQLARDYVMMTLGALLTALAFNYFFLPHDLAPGGVTGIATVLSSVLPLGVGLISFLINVPLFLMGYRSVGWRFAVRSFIAMMLLSLFIDTLPSSDVAGDMMLASIFGGVIMGVGLGLVVRAGATTGGTDMLAILIHNVFGALSIANILLMIDGTVVLIAAAVFGLKAGLYALIALFVTSKAMDAVIKGFNTAMQFMIITREPQRIISRIHKEMDRGCTQLEARGTYSGQAVGTLLCVVSRLEVGQLKKIISEIDPRAFVTVCDVHEALGEGFTGIREE